MKPSSMSKPFLSLPLSGAIHDFRKCTAGMRVWARLRPAMLATAFASRCVTVRFLTILVRTSSAITNTNS